MWDRRFAGEDYVFGTAPNAFLVSQGHRLVAGTSALAVADGEGRNGVWLAERGLDVLSVDASAVALAKARRLAESRGVRIATELVDLTAWDWPAEAFDAVVAIFIQFVGPAGREAIFAGMRRALKPGGLLLIQGYRPEQLAYGTGGPKAIENLYTRDLLEQAFGDLEILALREHDDDVEEGAGHSGRSALIDLVAVKPAG